MIQIKHTTQGLQVLFFFFKKNKIQIRKSQDLLDKALSQNKKIKTCLFYVNKHVTKHTNHFLKYVKNTPIHLISFMKGIPGKESRQNMGRKEPELSPKDMCLCPRAPGAWTTAEVSCTVEH